ncbi:hypothetical protein [Mycolicibacterium litorale]|uniref:hypothetical protein n=1 Tax=Mycolicibacterium litorale TaxID=758802 RepID=UPI0015D1C799|nr:hypothetical protein [Mycolicibacterium litorale]MCV7416534.1 hypothetical protein [Mycolicibacterium litorale]
MSPLAYYACQAYAATTPEGERRVLHDLETEGMFIDDLVLVARGHFPPHHLRRPTLRTEPTGRILLGEQVASPTTLTPPAPPPDHPVPA